jgi:phosphate starvation-inducible protein PhoH
VVRHRLVKAIIKAYDKEKEKENLVEEEEKARRKEYFRQRDNA